ncbi:MAG: electron transfer flavoprotein subunit alpha/FixB family protein, partial [Dehalococcoidia bacterium]|nr:electron transfer flavoprotein subunit alpha/FixB family protein [Dehalococcoidia bacterium]
MNRGEVLVYAEARGENPLPSTLELLGIGRNLAQTLGARLAAVLLGDGLGDAIAQELGAFGADRVYLADSPELRTYRSDPHLSLLEQLCR